MAEKFYLVMAASFYKWLMVGTIAFFHPFFVSVTEINHNAKEKTLEISCKVFSEDLEKTIKKQLNTPVELVAPKDPKKAQQLVSDYVKKHLIIKIDGKQVSPEFIGYEVEGASLWSYFQVSNIASVHKIEVSDNLLYEMFDSQIGIVHAQVGNDKKSSRVTNPDTNITFEF
ncbi:MAG: hypothetical protein QM726_20895 [Chitinophagaceae bacterium]